jgi:hypothetical protein
MDVFSSPLNPQMFAHLASTGILESITGPSSDIPSSNPSPARLLHSSSYLNAHDSQQGHLTNSSFASPAQPYQKVHLPGYASSAPSPYGIKQPKLQRTGMVDISSSLPHTNGTSHNGLPNGRHIGHGGDDNTHSRQGSTGRSFVKSASLLPSHLKPTRICRLVNVLTAFLHNGLRQSSRHGRPIKCWLAPNVMDVPFFHIPIDTQHRTVRIIPCCDNVARFLYCWKWLISFARNKEIVSTEC